MDATARDHGAPGRTVLVACSNVQYLVRCECRLVFGRVVYRGQCHIHGPAQPAVHALPPVLAPSPAARAAAEAQAPAQAEAMAEVVSIPRWLQRAPGAAAQARSEASPLQRAHG